jgi:O-antigen ligase
LLPRLVFIFAWAALLAGLTLPTIAPEIANVTTLIFMGVGLLVLAVVPAARAVLRQRAVLLALLAGLVLLLALAMTARSPMHIIAILVLAPLWLAGMHAGLLVRLGRWLTPLVIASFALAGAAGGGAIAAFDVLVRQQDRGGFLVNNPIHLADLSLMLGFVALVGLLDRRPIRLLFLLGPVLALVTVWFSGSRGPLVAFVPMLVVGGIAMAWMTLPRRMAIAAAVVVIAAVGFGGFAIVGLRLGGRLSSVGEVSTVLLTGTSADGATSERLFMYQSAWNAYWASPWFGHGMIDYTAIARQYAPPGPEYPISEHLHSDIANFAVIGGGLALLSYGLLLVAPLAGGLAVRGPNRRAAVYLGLVAGVGYFGMGLTNAMFGVLSQTVVYAVILALIAALGQLGRGETT